VLPVPFERSSSWIRGSAQGAGAVIEASAQVELYDIETDSQIYTQGIHTAEPVFEETAESMIEAVRKKVALFLNDRKLPVLIGGEHTVSIGAAMACRDHFNDLSILHLDAHADRRESYNNDPYSHASTIARIKDIPADVVSVGIRSMDYSEKESAAEDTVVYAYEAVQSSGWIERVTGSLSDHVYATIDMDVFDPAFVPSVGTPEPGGLGWYTVTGLMRNICLEKRIVGFDIVELCPGENRASDFTAAKLIYTLLSYIGDRNT
jgi:agmatinase